MLSAGEIKIAMDYILVTSNRAKTFSKKVNKAIADRYNSMVILSALHPRLKVLNRRDPRQLAPARPRGMSI